MQKMQETFEQKLKKMKQKNKEKFKSVVIDHLRKEAEQPTVAEVSFKQRVPEIFVNEVIKKKDE